MLRIFFTCVLVASFASHLAAQQADEKTELVVHLSHAKQLLAEQKPSSAILEYEAALAIDPGNVEAHANLGVVLFFQNQCFEASVHLSRALETQPDLAKLQALLGVCEKREGKSEEAKRNLEHSLPSITDAKARALIEDNLVALYYAEGNLGLASRMAEDLLQMDPHDIDVLYMTYLIHTHIAIAARNTLAAIAPNSGRMHQMMAEHFINEGDAPDSIAQYQRALLRDPTLPGVHYELAEAILQDSRSDASLDKATTLLNEALKENPRNADAEAKLGVIAELKNSPDMAAGYFSRALSLQSNQLDALEGLADIEAHKGNNEGSVNYLVRASLIDPMDDKLHYRLSHLYRALNRKADSDRELELFTKIRDLKKGTELAEQRATAP